MSRLQTLGTDLPATPNYFVIGGASNPITYNPASQIASEPRSNDSFAFNGLVSVNRNYTSNGLNQYSAVASNTCGYDARGNLTSDGTTTYGYSSENLLTSTSAGVTLSYDPLGRLYQVTTPTATRRFRYDGAELLEEYDGSGARISWYVHGPGADEAIAWGDVAGSGQRRYLQSDERGSVVAVTDTTGALATANKYDEYGMPGSGNSAERLQYTGQMYLPELGMYYYKARMYSATLGRFMQTDPIGYADSPNAYAYVRNDPVNMTDPSGLCGPNEARVPIDVPVVYGSDGSQTITAAFTCVRLQTNNPPSNSAGKSGGRGVGLSHHRYVTVRRITRRNTKCTAAQVSQATNRNAIPGNYGDHVNGQSYTVSTLMGYSPGTVTFLSNSGGTVFSNVTNSDHALCCCSVTISISGDQDSGFTATVMGTGYNESFGVFSSSEMADINTAMGPDIFNVQLQNINGDLLGRCGG